MGRLVRNWAFVLAVLTAGLAGIGLAHAADMRPPIRKAPAAPLGDGWSGFYAGGNLGYGFAHSANEISNSSGLQRENFDLGVTGAVGGGQIGYNWRVLPNWVAGLEVDLQGANQTASACTDICNSQFGLFATTQQKISWFGTVRGRVGWTNGSSLFYLTGGWAYGQVKTWLNEKLDTAPFSDITFSHNTSGWTIGTGIETWLSDHWTAKVEYLYVNLGSASDSFVYLNAPLVILTPTSSVQNHVVRLGVNYHLAAHAAGPASTSATPAATSWSGFYVGANIGYGIGRNPTTLNDRTVPAGTPFVTENYDVGTHGAVGGGQIGLNWQPAPNWLIGIEADLQAANVTASSCTVSCFSMWYAKAEQKQSWFGTARGRLGWVNGSVLFYATGGLAYGEVSTSITHRINNPPGPVPSAQFDYTKTGWTAGGGMESQIANNWSAKVEYLYVDLGGATETIAYPANSSNFTTQTSFYTHVVRVGLNYRFGGSDVVRARY
jgi:outer membrane immunogenic protein